MNASRVRRVSHPRLQADRSSYTKGPFWALQVSLHLAVHLHPLLINFNSKNTFPRGVVGTLEYIAKLNRTEGGLGTWDLDWHLK